MKTKIIPFDLETAKKIQAGEIKGKIKTLKGFNARVICWDRLDTETPIIVLVRFGDWECIFECTTKGEYMEGSGDDAIFTNLVLEVTDNEPQFKPFDKVLVRCSAYGYTCWRAAFYSHYEEGNDDKHHVTTSGAYYMDNEILPYEGNEHLVGTTDKQKEN